ncbi:MAG: transposase [Candidatus Woesebacteria bacterium]|nr:transposase [Candidatus Woesebacteria bacterium]
MPAKNSIKIPVENGFYHIYNRGVNKQDIFENPQDYAVFLGYLKEALSPIPEHENLKTFEVEVGGVTFIRARRLPKNFKGEIDLITYALIPNHFHLIIKQNRRESMEHFMKSIATRYSMYFNKSRDRVGPLFQGVYKAVLVENENYLLHLSRYIHLNPKGYFKNLADAYSSYADYLGKKKTPWLNPHPVLDYFKGPTNPEFKKINNYKDFVEKYNSNNKTNEISLESLLLDS